MGATTDGRESPMPAEAFTELFGRMPDLVHEAVQGLSETQLAHRPTADANSIAWLVWHLSRIEDGHFAEAARTLGLSGLDTDLYVAGYADRFGLPFAPGASGYGMTSDEVGQVRASAELLLEYYAAVHERTIRFLAAVPSHDWGLVVDERWDPPVTLLVRVASVINDVTQHVGQAAYARGLLG